MREFLLVVLLGAAGVVTVARAAAPGTLPSAGSPLKCVDCEQRTCRAFSGPGSLTCTMTPEECESWGECG